MERMPGEQGGHHRAAPENAGQPFEHQEEQGRIGGVQEYIDDVRRTWTQPEELTVKRMRQPGQRVPVAGVTDLKTPAQTQPTEAVFEVVIVDHIKAVVE